MLREKKVTYKEKRKQNDILVHGRTQSTSLRIYLNKIFKKISTKHHPNQNRQVKTEEKEKEKHQQQALSTDTYRQASLYSSSL